jgi:hypothetical protein
MVYVRYAESELLVNWLHNLDDDNPHNERNDLNDNVKTAFINCTDKNGLTGFCFCFVIVFVLFYSYFIYFVFTLF